VELGRQQGSYLLTQFREFYRELSHQQRQAGVHKPLASPGSEAESLLGPEDAVADEGEFQADPNMAGQALWQTLLSLLERQAMEASQSGGAFAYEVYREAQYVMAALADEIFLHTEWVGRENWQLLETRLFQTHYAGEEVFDRLDRLLKRSDPFYIDLASVYFMALSLGFQGKYRGHPLTRLDYYKQQLFIMVYRRQPKLFHDGSRIFSQTYQNTLDKMQPKRLPSQWVWLWLFGGVLAVWLLVSQVAWYSATSELQCLICHLLKKNCSCQVDKSALPSGQSSIGNGGRGGSRFARPQEIEIAEAATGLKEGGK